MTVFFTVYFHRRSLKLGDLFVQRDHAILTRKRGLNEAVMKKLKEDVVEKNLKERENIKMQK